MSMMMKKILIILFLNFCLSICLLAQEDSVVRNGPITTRDTLHLSVKECVELALSNNISLKNARLEVGKAQETKKAAFAKYLPSLSVQALGFQAKDPLIEYGVSDIDNAMLRQVLHTLISEYGYFWGYQDKVSMLENGTVAQALVLQPVYAGGRIRNGNKLARLGIEAAHLQQDVLENEVAQQTEYIYWQIVSLREKKETLSVLSTLLDTLHKDVKSAVDAGLIMSNDLLKVTVKQNECALNLKKVDDGITMLMMALGQYTGTDWHTMALTDTLGREPAPESFFREAQQAVAQRSETRLLDLAVEAENLQKKMTLGAALPSLVIGGSCLHHTLFAKGSSNLIAFAVLQVPVTDWYKTGVNMKKHDLDKEIALNNRLDLTQKMELQTNQAWFALQQSWQQIALAKANVEQAEANLKITKDFYEAGLSTLSELLEAQTLLKSTRDEYVDDCIAYRINLLKYRQLTGL